MTEVVWAVEEADLALGDGQFVRVKKGGTYDLPAKVVDDLVRQGNGTRPQKSAKSDKKEND